MLQWRLRSAPTGRGSRQSSASNYIVTMIVTRRHSHCQRARGEGRPRLTKYFGPTPLCLDHKPDNEEQRFCAKAAANCLWTGGYGSRSASLELSSRHPASGGHLIAATRGDARRAAMLGCGAAATAKNTSTTDRCAFLTGVATSSAAERRRGHCCCCYRCSSTCLCEL